MRYKRENVFAEEEEKQKQAPVRVKKVGRNDPCPCGSGKKYKKCCGRHLKEKEHEVSRV